jgi:hypothetical protein
MSASNLNTPAPLPKPQPRNFFLVPTVGAVRLLGWCKVKVDRNWGLGDVSRGMLECCTGRRVRIIGIDAENHACRDGGTDAAVDEGAGVRYGDCKRDHNVKCWNHPG